MTVRIFSFPAFIAIITLLSACSGGGGGGASGTATFAAANPQRTLETSYTGLRTAANLRPENSLTFLARSLEAVEFLPAFGDILGTHTPSHNYSFFRTEEDLLFDTGDVISEDQLCDTGSSSVVDELDPGNGLGLVRQVFANCFVQIESDLASNGGASIDGELWVNIRRRNANGAVILHDVEIVDLQLTDYVGRRVQVNGTIQVNENRLSGTLEMNFLSESVQILLENFSFQPDGNIRYLGRIYQSDTGYADFTAEHVLDPAGNSYSLELLGLDSVAVRSTATAANDNIGRYLESYDVSFFNDVDNAASHQTSISHEQLFRRISSANRIPVPLVQRTERVERASPAELRADSSTDPDADFLFYEWVVASEPVDCSATIEQADSAVAQLLADCVGDIEVSLTVSDRISTPVTETATVTALNYLADYSIEAASQEIIAGQSFSAQVNIANPEDGPFQIRLASGPEGMAVDAQGNITWDSSRLPILATETELNITVDVSNERTVRQNTILRVTADVAAKPYVHATLEGSLIGTANLDADNSREALFITRDKTLFALEHNSGNLEHMWSYNEAFEISADPRFASRYEFVELADINGDQRAEIIIVGGNVVHVLDSLTRDELFSMDLNPLLPACAINCGFDYLSMLVADIDNNGSVELLVVSYDETEDRSVNLLARMISIPGGETLYTLSNIESGVRAQYTSPVANLDGDPSLEILGSREIWDFVEGTVRSVPDELAGFMDRTELADLNGDGSYEILHLVRGQDGGDSAQIIRFDPSDFSETGRITLPSLTDSDGRVFNDHSFQVLGDIDSIQGDEILLLGSSHTERALIDVTDEVTVNIKLRHNNSYANPDGFAYADFTGDGAVELLTLPSNLRDPQLRLFGGAGTIVSDSQSYASRAYARLKGGALLAPDLDSNTIYFSAFDQRSSDTSGFDSRMQRVTFDLNAELFDTLGAPGAFLEPGNGFVSSLSRLFEYPDIDLNGDGYKDLVLHEQRGSFPSSTTFWVSAFDGQDMSTLVEHQVVGAGATFDTYSTGLPSLEDSSFSIYSSQYSSRLFTDGDLVSTVPVNGKPKLLQLRQNEDASLYLLFSASGDYADTDNVFSRGFNIADINPANWALSSTLIETIIPFYEYEHWFFTQQDIDNDGVDEIIIAATKSESDYDNQTELIVLNADKEVLANSVIVGRVSALGQRSYGSASPNVWLSLTNHDYPPDTRNLVSSRLVSIDALTGIIAWKSPKYTGEALASSLHIIDSPDRRHRLVVSAPNYVMVSR